MRKATVVWMIVAAALIVVGGLIFVGVMSMVNWNFSRLNTTKYVNNTHEIASEFHNIVVQTNTADVILLPSEDESCRVVCKEQTKCLHSAEVVDGTLEIRLHDTRKWYDHISIFSFGTPTVTLYLPKTEYENLTVSVNTGDVGVPSGIQFRTVAISGTTGDVSSLATVTDAMTVAVGTGDVRVENASVGAMALSTTTGDIKVSSVTCREGASVKVTTGDTRLTDLTCRSFESTGGTGDLSMKNVLVTEKLSVNRNTGDVMLDRCDAAEIMIETNTGDVTGSLCSAKIFLATSTTGDIHVPQSTEGGRCEIHTTTGEIYVTVE